MFDQIFGALTGQLGNMANAGGQNTPAPTISTGGVLNPQQIQQQVNTGRAATDAATGSRIATSNASLAGRGFGANSPLAQALGQGYQNQGLAANTAQETQTRLGAAEMNAKQRLAGQSALSNQWYQGNQTDIERRKPYFQTQNALIAALGGMA
jgi:hypothetical protein